MKKTGMIGDCLEKGGKLVALGFGSPLAIRRTGREIASSCAKSQLVRIKPPCLTRQVFG